MKKMKEKLDFTNDLSCSVKICFHKNRKQFPIFCFQQLTTSKRNLKFLQIFLNLTFPPLYGVYNIFIFSKRFLNAIHMFAFVSVQPTFRDSCVYDVLNNFMKVSRCEIQLFESACEILTVAFVYICRFSVMFCRYRCEIYIFEKGI